MSINRPGGSGSPLTMLKPTKIRTMALYIKKHRSPKPKGGLGPIVVNHHDYVTCNVS